VDKSRLGQGRYTLSPWGGGKGAKTLVPGLGAKSVRRTERVAQVKTSDHEETQNHKSQVSSGGGRGFTREKVSNYVALDTGRRVKERDTVSKGEVKGTKKGASRGDKERGS